MPAGRTVRARGRSQNVRTRPALNRRSCICGPLLPNHISPSHAPDYPSAACAVLQTSPPTAVWPPIDPYMKESARQGLNWPKSFSPRRTLSRRTRSERPSPSGWRPMCCCRGRRGRCTSSSRLWQDRLDADAWAEGDGGGGRARRPTCEDDRRHEQDRPHVVDERPIRDIHVLLAAGCASPRLGRREAQGAVQDGEAAAGARDDTRGAAVQGDLDRDERRGVGDLQGSPSDLERGG